MISEQGFYHLVLRMAAPSCMDIVFVKVWAGAREAATGCVYIVPALFLVNQELFLKAGPRCLPDTSWTTAV